MSYDPYTKTLIHFYGADGSTTFLDEYRRKWTPAGNAQIDTALTSPFGNNNGVGLFDGTGDYIQCIDSADFDIGTADFTFDFWAKATSEASSYDIFEMGNYTNAHGVLFEHITNSGGTFTVYLNGSLIISALGAVGTSWSHFAIIRNGTAVNLYKNGTSIGSGTSSANITTTEGMKIAGANYSGATFNGYLAEFRYSLGVARWTTTFTPPTAPYDESYKDTFGEYIGAGIGTTKGLYHLNGNSLDVSNNGFDGADTAISYSSAYGKFGQGALFNGSTSTINIGAHLTSATGTILWWMKPVAITSGKRPWSDTGGYLYVEFNASNQMRAVMFDTGGKTTSYVNLSTSSRDFWAVTWDSTTLSLYKNGALAASVGAGAIGNVTGTVGIGGTTGTFSNVEIDEFILENVAWSASRIRKYYTWSAGRLL